MISVNVKRLQRVNLLAADYFVGAAASCVEDSFDE